MYKVCKICDKQFLASSRNHNAETCSIECGEVNRKNVRRKRHNNEWQNRKDELYRLSELYKLNFSTVKKLGKKFLEENPMVVETLQIADKLAGTSYKFLSEEEKLIRKEAVRESFNERYRKPEVKDICKVCNKEFLKGKGGRSHLAYTCCDECGKKWDSIKRKERKLKQK